MTSVSRVDQILLCIGFLTRIRVRLPAELPEDALSRAAWAFPLAGATVGLLAAFAMLVSIRLGIPVAAAAIVALGTSILVTGALHEDGLADTADGLGGGNDQAAKLAIMRDSRIGSYGVLALLVCFGLKAVALATLAGHGAGASFWALIACHGGARAGVPLLMSRLPLARSNGAAASFGRPDGDEAVASLVIGVILLFGCLGLGRGLLGIAGAALGMFVIGHLARRQIGGYTGDILGAAEQLAETAILLAAADYY